MVADSVRRMSSWFLSGEEEGEQKGMESIAEGDDSKAGDEQQELEGKECDSVERVDGADSSGTGVANANETALHENEEAEPTAAEPTAAEPTAAEPTAAEPTAAEPTAAEPTAAEPSAVTELKDDVLASTEVASKAIASPEKGVQGGGEETGLGDEFVTGGEERVEERLAIVGPTVDADTVGVGVDTVVELVVAADMTGQAKTSTPEAATTGPVAKATYEGVVAEEMQEEVEEEEVEEEEVEEKAAETLDNADKIRGKMEEDNNGKQEVAEAPEEREENEEAEQGQKEAQQKEGQKETELKQMPKEKEEEEES
jgi:hypothetical protein